MQKVQDAYYNTYCPGWVWAIANAMVNGVPFRGARLILPPT